MIDNYKEVIITLAQKTNVGPRVVEGESVQGRFERAVKRSAWLGVKKTERVGESLTSGVPSHDHANKAK